MIQGHARFCKGVATVRLIGMDTPETVDPRKPVQVFGREASEFTRRLAQGKVVRLEFDYQRTDKCQRTLAYVSLSDGTFLNAEIVKARSVSTTTRLTSLSGECSFKMAS